MSLAADLTFPQSFVWGDLAATGRTDAQAARDYFSSGRQQGSILGDPASTFLWAGGHLADAWPASPNEDEYSSMQTSNVETLVISGTLDFATPPAVATNELLPYLPNGHQVLLQGFGHTTDVWTHQKEASNRLINTFFDKGQVDDSLYQPLSVDFTPEVSQPWLAKGIAGTMIGLALVAVLSLLWMARRVHRRGQFGRKASATLRSLYPIVLGLGGWFLGALIVLTTGPGVPLDDQLLVVLSVGVPIGLGIYWAWVHRDWSSERKGVGTGNGCRRRGHRRLAWVPRLGRPAGPCHHDRRCHRRRQSRRDRPRHGAGPLRRRSAGAADDGGKPRAEARAGDAEQLTAVSWGLGCR